MIESEKVTVLPAFTHVLIVVDHTHFPHKHMDKI